MKVIALCAALCAVAGCGVDGAPIQPSATTTVGVGTSGVKASTNVSASTGKLTVGVGLGL